MKTMKRTSLAAVLLVCALLLSGCGSLFDRDYVAESVYVPAAPDSADRSEKLTVHNIAELKQAVLKLVTEGETERQIAFDASYDGDVAEDIAAACWQVRTQDALCAYCVESISYELTKIVSYTEARLTVSYTEAGLDPGSIVKLQVVTGAEELIRSSMEQGVEKLAVLIQRSSYSADSMGDLVTRVYRRDPTVVPKEPRVTVNMLSGSGTQRLYEINFNYGMDAEELAARQEQLRGLEPFAQEDLSGADAAHRALLACEYLTENCEVSVSSLFNSAYDALIEGEANSEGLALAYVALCRELGVDCRIVYGQRNWTSHCWNIIGIGGSSYHVDPSVCALEGIENGFLLSDEEAWQSCRWDMSSYPRCTGTLRYADLLPPVETGENNA